MFRSRRVTVALLAGCLGLAAILLVALNAFNLHFLNPRDSNGIFLFTALSILVFLLLLVLLVLLCIPAWRSFWPRLFALAGLAAAVGFTSAKVASWRALPIQALPSKAVVMTGTVRAVDILPDGRRLVLDQVRLGDADPVARRLRVRC